MNSGIFLHVVAMETRFSTNTHVIRTPLSFKYGPGGFLCIYISLNPSENPFVGINDYSSKPNHKILNH